MRSRNVILLVASPCAMIEITSKLFGFFARSSQISFMCSANSICLAKRSSSDCTGASGALMSQMKVSDQRISLRLVLDRIVEQRRQHHRVSSIETCSHPVERLAARQPVQHHVGAVADQSSIFASVTGLTVELTSRR